MKNLFADARDNSPKTVKDIKEKVTLRRSEIEDIVRCPANGYANMLGLGTKRVSRAAITGALQHKYMEAFLRGLYDPEEVDVFEQLVKEGVSREDAKLLFQYQVSLLPLRPRVKAVEHEFNLGLVLGAPLFQGTLDAVFELLDGGVKVLDHKSNRVFEPESVWKERFQPMSYAMAASILWPEAKYIEFEIGYVSLNKKVCWRPDLKRCHSEVIRIVSEVWSEIKVYTRTGVWPERLNEWCGWCSIRDSCRTLIYAHENFMESLVQIQEKPLVERYLYAKNVLASIEAKTNELKAELVEQIQNSGGKLEHEGMLLYLYNGKRREIDYSAFASAVADTMKQSPEIADKLQDRYYELLDSALTVKMGLVDALVTEFPSLKPAIESAITTSASESPTLRVTVKDKK